MTRLRPLLLNSMDIEGGAAIATRRIHLALRGNDVDSTMYVQRKRGNDPTIIGPRSVIERALARPRRALDQIPVRVYPARRGQLFSPAIVPDTIRSTVRRLDPDLVHLFWVTAGFMRPESLSRLGKPLVWTLHDMWPFTGGCHYDDECGKYQDSCGACPQLGSTVEGDLSRRLWQRKRRAWERVDITIVATSHWLAKCARASALFSRYRIEVIPNCIDTLTYRPMQKTEARKALGLPLDKQLILLSAFGATTDARKGYQHLVPAIQELAKDGWGSDTELVVLGAPRPSEPNVLGIGATYIPHLSDEASQVLLYSACDVLVAPSTQENLSNTVLESLTCGTPVVAFDIGGMPDLIQHGSNGYLAKPFKPDDLAAGIAWTLKELSRTDMLSRQAREGAVSRFGYETIAEQYNRLYLEVIT